MKLTGKCREEFEYKYNMSNFNELDETLQNARLIEFFDSVGIYILPLWNKQYWYSDIRNEKYYLLSQTDYFDSRLKATNAAIIKANQIYNDLNNENK